MHDRPTGEIVVIIFALTIAAVLILSGAGVVVLELARPDATDTNDTIETLSEIIGVLIGAVLGFLGGSKGLGRKGSDERGGAGDN